MRTRFLFFLAATAGVALLLGAGTLGDWADDHRHTLLSKGCGVGLVAGAYVAILCLLRAVLPLSWWLWLCRKLNRRAKGVPPRHKRQKLPDDWRR
ncbi:hypothetical protein ACWEQ7_29610 [Streptomyces sp. NPDC004069]